MCGKCLIFIFNLWKCLCYGNIKILTDGIYFQWEKCKNVSSIKFLVLKIFYFGWLYFCLLFKVSPRIRFLSQNMYLHFFSIPPLFFSPLAWNFIYKLSWLVVTSIYQLWQTSRYFLRYIFILFVINNISKSFFLVTVVRYMRWITTKVQRGGTRQRL